MDTLVDAHHVHQQRFIDVETNDSESIILYMIATMAAMSVVLAACIYCCNVGQSPHSPDERALCDGLVVYTVLDAVIGGNRRERALRPFTA